MSKRETESLLSSLAKHGLEVTGAHYSGDHTDTIEPTWEEMSNMEDVCLYVRLPGSPGEVWIRLIYGNDPGELVADWAISNSDDLASRVDSAVTECSALFDH